MTDSFLTRPIFGDPDMARSFDDMALGHAILDVEAALARAEGRLGVIPDVSAAAIADSAARLFETAGAALRHALTLSADLRPGAGAMRTRLDVTPEVLAGAAVFALAEQVGRQAASRLVKDALSADEPLVSALSKAGPSGIDRDAALSPDQFIQPAAVTRAIFAARGTEHING